MLCLNLSAGVSATYQAAATAAKSFGDRIPVRVIDTRSMTMGLGLIVLDVAELASTGADLDQLADHAVALIPRIKVFGVVDTLEHLEKGGRIGGARALLGSLLSIKPVVTLVDGVVEEESKQRTRARSFDLPGGQGQGVPPDQEVGRQQRGGDRHRRFLAMLDGVQTEYPLVVVDLGPVVGTHTGPGTIGLSILTAA